MSALDPSQKAILKCLEKLKKIKTKNRDIYHVYISIPVHHHTTEEQRNVIHLSKDKNKGHLPTLKFSFLLWHN